MIYLDDLLQATAGELQGQAKATEFSGFAFDSRQLEPGELFLAVKTATGDGHNFIEDAIQHGATGVLCEYCPVLSDSGQGMTIVVVPDIQQALTDYAAYLLQTYKPRVVGVTGSSGKTTTKEAIAAILAKKYLLLKRGNVPKEYWAKPKFDIRETLPDFPDMVETVKAGRGIYLTGANGTGKTTTAIELLRVYLSELKSIFRIEANELVNIRTRTPRSVASRRLGSRTRLISWPRTCHSSRSGIVSLWRINLATAARSNSSGPSGAAACS